MYLQQLEFIKWIQEFRNPFLDEFFKCLNYFDRQDAIFVLIPIVWLWFGWKSGLRLFYILLLGYFTNQTLKEFFAEPRPFHDDATVEIVKAFGFGFPSGSAQNAVMLSGILLSVWKNRWKWLVVTVYIGLISFSRVYLGAHYVIDILGGWVVGLLLWAVYTYVFPAIEKQLAKFQPVTLFLLSQLIPILFLFWSHSEISISMCSVAIGLGIGAFGSYAYPISLERPKKIQQFIIRALIGVGLLGLLYLGLLQVPMQDAVALRFLLVGVWTGFVNPWVCSRK